MTDVLQVNNVNQSTTKAQIILPTIALWMKVLKYNDTCSQNLLIHAHPPLTSRHFVIFNCAKCVSLY